MIGYEDGSMGLSRASNGQVVAVNQAGAGSAHIGSILIGNNYQNNDVQGSGGSNKQSFSLDMGAGGVPSGLLQNLVLNADPS